MNTLVRWLCPTRWIIPYLTSMSLCYLSSSYSTYVCDHTEPWYVLAIQNKRNRVIINKVASLTQPVGAAVVGNVLRIRELHRPVRAT